MIDTSFQPSPIPLILLTSSVGTSRFARFGGLLFLHLSDCFVSCDTLQLMDFTVDKAFVCYLLYERWLVR